MEKENKICQSCGMPLKRDENNGGTESDGTKSKKYCSHCYQTGQFTSPDMTVNEMRDRVKVKMKEMGFPSFLLWFFVMNIPRLERWKTK
ncbi:MAG TPA: zinc ribbon domain-containing protein [Bacteroidales bacterium]|nr:zinc ribbon domain-containing protein [Bacteroidales bacterium]